MDTKEIKKKSHKETGYPIIKKPDICVLGLSKRVYFKLQGRGIRTIRKLMAKIDTGLKKVRGIGDAAYEEIVRQVRKAEIDNLLKYQDKKRVKEV